MSNLSSFISTPVFDKHFYPFCYPHPLRLQFLSKLSGNGSGAEASEAYSSDTDMSEPEPRPGERHSRIVPGRLHIPGAPQTQWAVKELLALRK